MVSKSKSEIANSKQFRSPERDVQSNYSESQTSQHPNQIQQKQNTNWELNNQN